MTAQNLPSQREIETGQSWIVAGTALLILSIAYGASLVTAVALQPPASACRAVASGFHAWS